ncbi:MAG: hydroxymethylglutaryl-CoA lyase [Acidimicrobiaceae bacterium]|nr:hydroxymethylglutaryl-CoA lyase [Acidimicrobiaceae bacterium]
MTGLPQQMALEGVPRSVTIHEVGPRDGLQNETAVLATATKADLVERLAHAGLTSIEVTAFVRPERVPQLADAEALVAELGRRQLPASVRLSALVPNVEGLSRALGAGLHEVAVFTSATESFAKANLNRSREESLAMIAAVLAEAERSGTAVRGYVSMCFGDPWEGAVQVAEVVSVGRRLVDLGCYELSLGDTIGVATPGHVVAMIEALAEVGVGPERLAVHFHDTYGQALANTLAALQCGVSSVDASAGGLGGCPFAKSATGNLATEDLVFQLEGLGVQTGVHLDELVSTSAWMAEQLGRPSASRVVRAMTKEDAR